MSKDMTKDEAKALAEQRRELMSLAIHGIEAVDKHKVTVTYNVLPAPTPDAECST